MQTIRSIRGGEAPLQAQDLVDSDRLLRLQNGGENINTVFDISDHDFAAYLSKSAATYQTFINFPFR